MKCKNALLTVTILAVLALVLSGCEGKKQEPQTQQTASQGLQDTYRSPNGNILVATLFQNPKTLDIQKTNADYFIPLQIYSRLVEAVPDGKGGVEIVPGLAESWTISEDGKIYTFKLKKGIKFHNGEEFKADDVLFTIEKCMDPKEAAINSWIFEPIEGAEEKRDGKSASVSGVKVIDDYTVVITLKEKYAPFIARLTDAPASIFNRKAVEEGKDLFGFDPQYTVGTGYLKFKDWKQDQEINLVRNENYFGEKAHIDGLRYLINVDASTSRMMFEKGELDVITINTKTAYDKYTGSDEWKPYVIINDRPGMTYVSFNENCTPMKDVRVRKAIQKGIDRNIINKTFFNGTATIINGCVPPMIPGYKTDLPVIEYNPEEAKKLLAEAGYKDGLELVLLQNGASGYTHPINEAIQAMLKNIGITITIKNMDMGAYWDVMTSDSGDHALSVGPVTAGAPDLGSFFSDYVIPAHKQAGYPEERVQLSDAIKAADLLVDPQERIKKFQELEIEVTQKQALYFPLGSTKGQWVISPRLENFQLSWQGWLSGATQKVKINPKYNK
ncbi:MAG: ABC transporter substrate-binding protein [Treponema sp.]